MLDEGWPAWSGHDRCVVQFGWAIFHLLRDVDDLTRLFRRSITSSRRFES